MQKFFFSCNYVPNLFLQILRGIVLGALDLFVGHSALYNILFSFLLVSLGFSRGWWNARA